MVIRTENKPEIYFLLQQGLSIKQIISLGFKHATVYKYARDYPKIKERVLNALRNV